MQSALARALLSVATKLNVEIALSDCMQTPRLAFSLARAPNAVTLLSALLDNGFLIDTTETNEPINAATLKSSVDAIPDQLVLYKKVLASGRMLHGPTSGLTLTLVQNMPSTQRAKLPSPLLRGQSVNETLAGLEVDLCQSMIERVAQSKIPDQLDIVYTWVNDADPDWKARRSAYRPDNPSADAEDAARFDNNNELLFSLRSLFRYFTGIGQVYLVTDAQTPDFLGEFEGRVQVVDHSDIMGADVARPVFNSHVIESCLHHIDGLSPEYLYLNDDFLFAKPSCPADFFDESGRSKAFFSTRAVIPKGGITDKTLAVDVAGINLRDLLLERFNHKISRKFQHAPVAMHRDVMFELESTFPEQFRQLRKNRFRSRSDLSPAGSFYLHYALMTGRAVEAKIKYRYYDTGASTLLLKLLKLSCESDRQRPNVHCINATGDSAMGRLKAMSMQYLLSRLYPPAASKRRQNTLLDVIRFEAVQRGLAIRAAYRRRKRAKENAL